MSQYIYNQLYQKINNGIYSVNDLYIRKKENTNLYDDKILCLLEDKKFRDAIHLIKNGKGFSQEIMKEIMIKCLTKSLGGYSYEIINLLVEAGVQPLSKEILINLLTNFYNYLDKIAKNGNVKCSDESISKILLNFEKKLKYMYKCFLN
jgi:hypothetical protein